MTVAAIRVAVHITTRTRRSTIRITTERVGGPIAQTCAAYRSTDTRRVWFRQTLHTANVWALDLPSSPYWTLCGGATTAGSVTKLDVIGLA